jgi:CheY-like chemotaxis protein
MTEEALRTTGHVLIVDDLPENLLLLRAQLELEGHRVSEAGGGEAALAAVRAEPPDLILLDVLMPGTDGHEVCRRLKADTATRAIPVIMLTALRERTDKLTALEAGADDFLTKPFDRAELLARVRSHLRSKFLYDRLARSRDEIRALNAVLEQRVSERTQELAEALSTLREAQAHVVQQERLRALGEMASGVAHDLNNALAPVVGFSDLLLMKADALDNREQLLSYLRLIRDGATSAADVVARLRQFYRPRDAHQQLAPVDLPALVERTIALTQPKWRDQAQAAGKSIRIETDLRPVPAIAGAESELRDLLTNLIFNAVDAIPTHTAGEPDSVIALRTRTETGEVVLEVSDTGGGMTEEVRRRCLEPFFTTKGEHGTGLGLSSVHGTLRRHGGALEIESRLGVGTTFRILLPIADSATPTEPALSPGGDGAVEVARSAAGATLRVLVVDDQPLVRQVIGAYVAADGHTVIDAAGAAEAIEILRHEAVDLLLADWAMPGMSGDQLAAAAKLEHPDLPVVMVTGFGDLANAAGEVIPGVDAIVGKPLTREKLRRVLTDILPRYDRR